MMADGGAGATQAIMLVVVFLLSRAWHWCKSRA